MKKILLVRTDKIGDVVLTTPMIKILRDHYPTSHIAFLTGPKTQALVQENPYLNEVIIYDKYQKHKSVFKTFLFSQELKKKQFDVVFIFNPSRRSHWMAWLANIPVRIGYKQKQGSLLLTHSFQDRKKEGLKSESFYNEDLLSPLHIPPIHSCDLYVPVAKKMSFKFDHPFIMINPSSGCFSKQWPLQNFALLVTLIHKRLHIKMVLIGNKKECQEIERLTHIPLSIVSENLTLPELALLFKNALLHISSDTGPMHIAAAVGTPVISIFGRSLPGLGPKRWAPLKGNGMHFQKNLGCNPCLAHHCQLDLDCLKAIKVEEVFHAVQRYTTNLNC